MDFTPLAPGVWSGRCGPDGEPRLREYCGGPPRLEALAALGESPFPFAPRAVTVETQPDRLAVRLPLRPEEQLYGLGLQFQTVAVRNCVRRLRVDHHAERDTGAGHAPVPLYVSSRGYGVLIDSARYMTIYAGTAIRQDSSPLPPDRDRATDPDWTASPLSDAVEVCVPGQSVEVLVFGGPTPLAAVQRYNLLCGGGCLPPRWGLGFWHRTPLTYSAAEVEAEAEEFARRGFPLDVIGLEPGWQSRCYPCTHMWDEGRFPDPAAFCHRLADRGVHVNLWENPYVSPRSPLHEPLAALSGSHTVWCGLVPDYTLPRAREITSEQHDRDHLRVGVSGYKLDEVDGFDQWLWPDHASFPSGHSGEVMRQTYGLQLQQLMTALFRRRNRRTYGLVRGTNAGASAYPFVLYSDCYSHQDFITALCASSFAGVLWTPEARNAPTAEEWLRRMQTTCLSPLAMLNAWASGTKPWSYAEVADEVREIMLLRARLLPYLYSAFARYYFEGLPPFRAMALEACDGAVSATPQGELDDTANPYALAAARDFKDQYLMGDCLLVAPLFTGQQQRQVWLPPGTWCDFYTGQLLEGGREVTVAPPDSRVPLFVRDGGIVPLLASAPRGPYAPCADGRGRMPADPPPASGPHADRPALEVRYYGRSAGAFRLYDDDGETYDYEQGDYCWTELRVEPDAGGTPVPSVTVRGPGQPQTYGEIRWRFVSQ